LKTGELLKKKGNVPSNVTGHVTKKYMKMRNLNIKFKTIFFLIIFFGFFGLAKQTFAAVVFESNFDSNADWNVSRENDSSTSDYYECGMVGYDTNTCRTGDYPTDWNTFRSASNLGGSYSGLHPKASIQRPPGPLADHTGTGTGKALIVYNESYPASGAPWPGDGILGKHFGSTSYQELYIQLWVKFQPSWQWAENGSSGGMANPTLKFFRVGHDAGGDNLYNMGSHHPWMIFDWMNFYPSSNGYSISYRCDPSDYYCESFMSSSHPNYYQYNDTPFSAGYTFSDASWHRVAYHIKMNTAGNSDGIMNVSLDGHEIYSKTNVQWLESGSAVPGFNVVLFGGNSVNPYVAQGEQWYSFDDITVSTTAIANDYIPGGGTADTTAPAAPTGLAVN
jgi:hypothetical protein